MIPRNVDAALREALARFPVVALVGGRQVGKTTLAKALAAQWKGKSAYLDLERPSDLAKLGEPELYFAGHRDSLVVLDEIQREPELFAVLRSLVDEDRHPGRFLVLGSASPALIRQSSESLAGRIVFIELSPLALGEMKQPKAVWRQLCCSA